MDILFTGGPVQCLCNPQAGYEEQRRIEKAKTPKKIAVIGAGPAGLEAAVTAVKRGHRVILFEESSQIGGQLPLVAAPPGRDEFMSLFEFYKDCLQTEKIDLRLGEKVTVEKIRDCAPDYVVVATGSRQMIPEIPGIDRPQVVTAWDVLLDRADLGETVAVIGGGAVGLETAIHIAQKGTISGETVKFLLKHDAEDVDTLRRLALRGTKKVTLIEMLSKIGQDIGRANRWAFLKEIHMSGIRVMTDSTVKEITEDGVIYTKEGKDHSLSVQSVVLALGARSNNEIVDELTEAGIEHLLIGDAKQPRNIMQAIHEGFLSVFDL